MQGGHAGAFHRLGGFLPADHQGTPLTVPIDTKTLPIENLKNASANDEIQRKRLELTRDVFRETPMAALREA